LHIKHLPVNLFYFPIQLFKNLSAITCPYD
jgi:hypothetical protein